MSDNAFSILAHLGHIALPPIVRLGTAGVLNEKECTVILYVSWSGPALFGTQSAIRLLHQKNYPHPVYLVDQDSLSIGEQFALFGESGHGWGEIFIYRQGIIVQKFTNKNAPWDFIQSLE